MKTGIVATHPSKSGGQPHVVGMTADGKYYCTCDAHKNGKTCWAVKKEQGMAKLRKGAT